MSMYFYLCFSITKSFNINQEPLLVARLKQKLTLKLDMLGTVNVCICLLFLHMLVIFIYFLKFRLATIARRNTESEVETQARRARDSRGIICFLYFHICKPIVSNRALCAST